MNQLQRAALASVSLSYQTVESFYDGSRSGTADQCLRALCVSHERLRAELQGVEILLDEANAKLALAAALTDTGSAEFSKAFPQEHSSPRGAVLGWRVVEKIREIVNGPA